VAARAIRSRAVVTRSNDDGTVDRPDGDTAGAPTAIAAAG
jgi:hypothetical protein